MEIILTQQQRDLLKQYKSEAFGHLSEIVAAKENLKDIYEVAAEATGLEKKVVTKLYNTLFKEKLDEMEEEIETLRFLAGE